MRIGANTDRPPFELAPRTTLAGHLAMIVSWWWDDEPALESASLGIALIPDLLLGQTDDFEINEWLIFAAALGAFYPRTPELEEIHALAVRGFKGELGIGRTKCFLNKETTAAAYMERPVNSRC